MSSSKPRLDSRVECDIRCKQRFSYERTPRARSSVPPVCPPRSPSDVAAMQYITQYAGWVHRSRKGWVNSFTRTCIARGIHFPALKGRGRRKGEPHIMRTCSLGTQSTTTATEKGSLLLEEGAAY